MSAGRVKLVPIEETSEVGRNNKMISRIWYIAGIIHKAPIYTSMVWRWASSETSNRTHFAAARTAHRPTLVCNGRSMFRLALVHDCSWQQWGAVA